MSMHKVHFINGESEIFFNVVSGSDWTYFKGYSDCANEKPVCIPLTSVLYVELINR